MAKKKTTTEKSEKKTEERTSKIFRVYQYCDAQENIR